MSQKTYIKFVYKRKNHSYEVWFTEEEVKEAFENEINFIRFCEKIETFTGVPILSKYAKLKFITEYIENINAGGK